MEQNKDQIGAAVRGEAVVLQRKLARAERALLRAGFVDLGAEEWKPPIGPQPRWVEVSVRAADAPSEPSEPQQKTIDCMDAWATSMQMPTYSELHALTEQYDALIRKICFQYAAGGYNSDGFMAPKSADLKLRWIIDEAYKSPSRAADALDSQPTVSDGWISVKDRLPELGQTVLAVNNEYGQRESKFDRWSQGSINRANYGEEAGYFNWQEPMNNWGSSWKPTHWMPLPPAPASSQPTDGGVRNG